MAPRTSPRKAPASASKSSVDLADLAAALRNAQSTQRAKDKYVGVRNISSCVIGVPNPAKGQPDLLDLHADMIDPSDPTGYLPNTAATQVIPHAVWMQLRRHTLYGRGMIVRDDSILGDSYESAPEDLPHDLHPDWAKNAVPRPSEWIEKRTETELSASIEAMTSEESLKRLLTAVNQRIEKQRLAYPDTDPRREEKAYRDIPGIYHKTESLVLDRLEALGYR